ncbi:protein ENHANCED DISEASE RESISTANCE 4-like [Vicia villosa]|uniref:protein ENHANCED DISEASE RESISTANCE 4-like n=1 Tax=Vicia villosa TaxID=3911 RepID=UPI00273C50BC|nr:protein ENHANCED DISEASE RESISTANCE 4-like [Vicia villosa]XP_058753138.1 protein ENHANCED DISEASE RESISTANCE 4-like [Vicia villosa]
MSGKLVHKLRIVKCPKCRQLLQEPQGYDVYKCGGCGTDLQAKKQSMAVKSDSSIQIEAAPGNSLHLVSDSKQRSDKKRRFPLRKDSLKAKETASSRECHMNGNSEYNGGQLVPFKFTDEEELEGELDIPKLSLRRHGVSKKVGSVKTTHCEIEEISNGDFSLERPKEKSISSSDEDESNDKSAPVGDIPKMEIAEINLEKLSPEEAAGAELISKSDEANVNIEKSVTEDANPEVKVIASDLGGAEGDLNVCALDADNEKSAIEDAKSEVETAEATTTKNPSIENVDTLDTTEQSDHSSELSDVHGKEKLAESPTTQSSNAYDDGLSPHDGINGRIPIQHLDSLKNTYTVDEGRIRKGKGPANGDFGTRYQSDVPEEKNHMVKDNGRDKNKVLENTSHGDSHFMKTKRDHEFPSRIPFRRNGYQSHDESGRPSNGMHDESSSFLSRDPREETDQEKVKLLGMIYKLQVQLNKTRYDSEKSNGRMATGVSYQENHNSAYRRHSHVLHGGRFSHALDHSRCNGRCNCEITSRQRHKYSRIPYSAEATSWAYCVDHPCHHCCSHVSADLSPRVHFQHEDLHRCCRAHDCCSSGPQYFTSSKLPLYSSDTNSDDLRYRATVARKYLREKQNLAKRHHRPVAGGAPFVTCPKCFKLLQLPADFLYKKACHQLKCGGCSEVLKFSLKDGTHVVPFSSVTTTGLPSRELHHESEVISGGKLPSKTHVNHHHYSPAKPISYYDDYGLSFSQSFSSEVDPAFLTQQIDPLHSSEYVNPGVSPSSTFKAKIIASRYFSSIAAPTETDQSTELSSNMSEPRKLSPEKAARPPRKSTLHKLMGYSTPSKVIKGTPC